MFLQKKYLITFSLLVVGIAFIVFLFFFLQERESRTFEQPVSTDIKNTDSEKQAAPSREISLPEDCANECATYKNEEEKYTYCRTVCGFTSEEGVVKLPTSTDPSLSNDYALRESAIRERNIKKCLLIKDVNIRDTCQARVAEDLLE